MRLERVTIENYRAIESLDLPLHPQLTVLHGNNADGKTSVLSAIAVGLGSILRVLPGVSGIDFLKTDRRGLKPTLIRLVTEEGLAWERHISSGVQGSSKGRSPTTAGRTVGLVRLREAMNEIIVADQEGEPSIDLPIVASYDTERAVIDVPQRRIGFEKEFSRYEALEGALSARADFREFFRWFYAKEDEELRMMREFRDFDYQLPDLQEVKQAIMSVVGVSQLHTELTPLRFVVSMKSQTGEHRLDINQLSGGYRIMLALVADLARRLIQGNPHREKPLESEAIVLIDEVDLHLHPSWQQRVLPDLMRTFPNAQFIVSTHSPQVLTTVRPEHIVELYREGEGIAAGGASEPTYGAPAGDVMTVLMRVKERPSQNKFVIKLDEYLQLVYDGKGESEDAMQLRHQLEELSPRDPGLDRADVEMRRQNVMQRIAESRQQGAESR